MTARAASAPAQGLLDLRPPKAGRPVRVRPVEERVKAALRRVVEGRHVGRDHAATWEQLVDELAAEGVEVNHVRRLQEAASDLRRVDKVAIVGLSGVGVFLVADDQDRKLAASERVKRLRAEVQELEALDRALYERIAGALPMEDAA